MPHHRPALLPRKIAVEEYLTEGASFPAYSATGPARNRESQSRSKHGRRWCLRGLSKDNPRCSSPANKTSTRNSTACSSHLSNRLELGQWHRRASFPHMPRKQRGRIILLVGAPLGGSSSSLCRDRFQVSVSHHSKTWCSSLELPRVSSSGTECPANPEWAQDRLSNSSSSQLLSRPNNRVASPLFQQL